MSSTTMTSKQGACANLIGYCNETSSVGALNPVFDGCTIIGTRYNSTIWNNGTGLVITFSNLTQTWGNSGGNPNFQMTGSGSTVGVKNIPAAGDVVSASFPAAPASKASQPASGAGVA